MSVSLKTRQAYAEVDEFLNLLSENRRNMIPEKLRRVFKDEKDINYIKNINPNISIKEQELQQETLAIIALLNLQYWCKDENEKQRLIAVYNNNEQAYQICEEMLQEQYGVEDVMKSFNKAGQIQENVEPNEASLITPKETLFKKIINRIKRLFNK